MKIILLMLSRDKDFFVSLLKSKYPQSSIDIVPYWYGVDRRKLVSSIRKNSADLFIICCDNVENRQRMHMLKLLSFLAKTKERHIMDTYGQVITCSIPSFVLGSLPLLVSELALGLPLIIAAYFLCFLWKMLPPFRGVEVNNYRSIAYLRTTFSFDLKAGGSATHISGFTRGVLRNKYDMFFLSSDSLAEIDPAKNPTIVVRPSKLFNTFPVVSELAYNLKFILKVHNIPRAKKASFLYQRYSRCNLSGIALARLLGLPLFLEFNSSEAWAGRYFGKIHLLDLVERIEDLNLRYADLVFVVSSALRRSLIRRGVDNRKIIVNPNGVNPEMFSPSIDPREIQDRYDLKEKITVGFVGTFEEYHGVQALVKAIPDVIEANKNFHFFLIGEGTLRQRMEQEIREMNLEGFVTFTGIVSHTDVPKILSACDILVLPHTPLRDGSEFFGSPTKMFEYMAMGKGIVASDLGQIGEILQHNKTAYVVKPGDKAQLAKGILALAKDKKLRERLGREARKHVAVNYTWEQNARRVIKAYESFIQNR